MTTEILLKNNFVRVEKNEKDITFYDLTDKYNDYKGFTRNTRGLDKAAKFISEIDMPDYWNIKIGDIVDILDNFNLKPHTYCGMD